VSADAIYLWWGVGVYIFLIEHTDGFIRRARWILKTAMCIKTVNPHYKRE